MGDLFNSVMVAVTVFSGDVGTICYALSPAVQAATSRLGKMFFGWSRHGCGGA